MLPSLAWTKLLVNSLSVLAMSYAASVITVAGAFFIASQVPGTLWHRGVNTAPSNSLKLTTSATSVINGDVSALLLNVEKELLKLKKQNCSEEVTTTIYLSHQPIPNLPFKRNFRKLRLISSLESAENWLNINSQCRVCESQNWVPFRSIQMENRWKHARNGSVFWQVISEAMQRSPMQRRLEVRSKLI